MAPLLVEFGDRKGGYRQCAEVAFPKAEASRDGDHDSDHHNITGRYHSKCFASARLILTTALRSPSYYDPHFAGKGTVSCRIKNKNKKTCQVPKLVGLGRE